MRQGGGSLPWAAPLSAPLSPPLRAVQLSCSGPLSLFSWPGSPVPYLPLALLHTVLQHGCHQCTSATCSGCLLIFSCPHSSIPTLGLVRGGGGGPFGYKEGLFRLETHQRDKNAISGLDGWMESGQFHTLAMVF